jgi:dTDP-4-amino-4,6-dideoxygalactose transaminase
METHLFVPRFEVEECLAEIRECLEKGWTGLGFKTVAFEAAWKDYTKLRHAHFLNSNTVGLHLALEIFKTRMQWNDGDEVITTPLTFVSTNHAILHAGLKPTFADVDPTLCLDPASVEERITPRTRAVMFVGIGGNTGQYEEIVKICRTHGLALILDAAHMAGTRLHGQHVGGEADAVVFSFQAVKNLPTADSGMICFKERADDEKVRQLTWLGINKDTYSRTESAGTYKWRYEVENVGYKYHGNSIMAAIGLVQLKYLDRDNAYRRQIVSWYGSKFGDRVRFVRTSPCCESASHLFQMRAKNRDDLMVALNQHQVYPGVHYRDNIDYPMYSYAAGTCPNAALASREVISLPLHLRLTKPDVERVADLVLRYAQ